MASAFLWLFTIIITMVSFFVGVDAVEKNLTHKCEKYGGFVLGTKVYICHLKEKK